MANFHKGHRADPYLATVHYFPNICCKINFLPVIQCSQNTDLKPQPHTPEHTTCCDTALLNHCKMCTLMHYSGLACGLWQNVFLVV